MIGPSVVVLPSASRETAKDVEETLVTWRSRGTLSFTVYLASLPLPLPRFGAAPPTPLSVLYAHFGIAMLLCFWMLGKRAALVCIVGETVFFRALQTCRRMI